MGGEAYGLSLIGAKFKILYYTQFLDRKCGIGKNCWLNDDYILGLCVHCWIRILTVFEVNKLIN